MNMSMTISSEDKNYALIISDVGVIFIILRGKEKTEYAAIHHRGYYRHRLCRLFVLEGVAVAVGQG